MESGVFYNLGRMGHLILSAASWKGGTHMEKGDWQKRVAGHRERLRQKFLKHGLEKLTDEETIELLLTLGTPRRDCKQIAREALRRFQSFAGVLEAPEGQLRQVPGIGRLRMPLV